MDININATLDDIEIYSEKHICTMQRATMELRSPFVTNIAVWPNPLDLSSIQSGISTPTLINDVDKDLLSMMSRSISESIQFPLNTCYFHGLGCVASAMTKAFKYEYRDNKTAPVNLYCVSAQPPSTGKSGVNDYFSDPIVKAFKEINDENSTERKVLQREIKNINKKLEGNKELQDTEEMELFDRLDKATEQLELIPLWSPIVTDLTIEAAEELAGRQGGMFNIVSAEAEAVSVILGAVYGDDSGGKKANYGLLLKAWDGEYSHSIRITRSGYNGYVRASISVIAQNESVESILAAAASGRGLAERFLLLVEDSLLGNRNHKKQQKVSYSLVNKYEVLISNIIKEGDVTLKFSESSKRILADWRQKIEPELRDGGIYSHNLLTGFIGKADKQIMKIASVLHCVDHWQTQSDRDPNIKDFYINRAIYIFEQLAQTYISAADSMGYVGEKSELIKICDHLQKIADKGKLKVSYSQLYNSLKNIKPFRGSRNLSKKIKDQLIPKLEELNYCVADGKTVYINPRLK